MMLNTLSGRVHSVRNTDAACGCEFNIMDLGTVLASSKNGDCISGVMVSVLSSNAVDVVKPKTKHAALRSKSKNWLFRNQNNVSEWGDMFTRRFLFQ